MRITLFENLQASAAPSYEATWEQIYAHACAPAIYAAKQFCPLIKLATFGTVPSTKGSMRHDANILAISGIEGDYDGELVTPEAGVSALTAAGVYALIYTSPSHTPDKPRWRVLAPLSREHDPSAHRELVGRLNGALGGILGNESFTLTQSYYWGAVGGVEYKCLHAVGNYLDLMYCEPVYPVQATRTLTDIVPAGDVTQETLEELWSALQFINADDRNTWISVGQDLCKLGAVGYQLWDAWSKLSAKYDPADMWRWGGFTGDRTDHRAIFAKAQALGWVNPRAHKPVDLSGVQFEAGTGTGEPDAAPMYMPLDAKLEPDAFNHKSERLKNLATTGNLRTLFNRYGVQCYYDEVLKEQFLHIANGGNHTGDMSANGKLQHIKSLCALNEVPSETTDRINVLLMENTVNPVVQYISGKPWDGTSRLAEFYETVKVNPEDIEYRNHALYMWLVQCVAAADGAELSPRRDKIAKFEACLVFQGIQGRLKTTWVRSLLPANYGAYIKDSVTLDLADKDSRKLAISGWICELGELDSTFRKSDISRLKGFLSSQVDEIRLPYDRVPSKFQRRTSFFASVNEPAFLVDDTGNRRFLPIAVHGTNPYHGIDMQQLWAEIWDKYLAGEQWWPNAELLALLPARHDQHSQLDHIEDAVRTKFDLSVAPQGGKIYSCTEILAECGWTHSNKADINAVARVLRKHGIEVARSSKKRGYRLALLSPFDVH